MYILVNLSEATVSQEPEIKSFDSGSVVLKIKVRVANGEPKKEGDQYAPAEWFTIEVWGKLAQSLAPMLHKHSDEAPCRLNVTGSLVTRTYQAGDGTQKTEMLIKNPYKVDLLDRKYSNEKSLPSAKSTTKPVTPSTNDDDVPF